MSQPDHRGCHCKLTIVRPTYSLCLNTWIQRTADLMYATFLQPRPRARITVTSKRISESHLFEIGESRCITVVSLAFSRFACCGSPRHTLFPPSINVYFSEIVL